MSRTLKPWNSGHYNDSQKPVLVARFAEKHGRELERRLNGAMPIFCYQGMSGVTYATALSLVVGDGDVGMIYVRKKGEVSHSGQRRSVYFIPRPGEDDPLPVVVFVDDFVSSGKTRQRVLSEVKDTLGDATAGGIKTNPKFYLTVTAKNGVKKGRIAA